MSDTEITKLRGDRWQGSAAEPRLMEADRKRQFVAVHGARRADLGLRQPIPHGAPQRVVYDEL